MVAESIIKDEMIRHLTENELIIQSQHGFLLCKSCSTNLLNYLNEVTSALDSGLSYDVIMIDFRRAFDLVPFRHMIRKLEAHGIVGDVLRWISDWTRDRVQRVVLNGESSTWVEVLSSVVQGSVLGPVLFIIFINDIDLVLSDPSVKIFKYADDSKLGRPIRSDEDSAVLQSSLDNVYKWSLKWGMEIHPMKTKVLHFGYSNPRHTYMLNGVKVTSDSTAKDLGVIIHESCKPSQHVSMIARKANGVLAQLHRTLVSRDRDIVLQLYKIFVRPILESAVAAWCPWERKDIDVLERVQRRATRLVPAIGGREYADRLIICNLTTLEQRRERGDAIEVFKMMNGFTHVNISDFFNFTSQRHDTSTRSVTNKLLVPEKCRLDVRKHFFSNRIVQIWNELPLEVRESETINCFKNIYDEWTCSSR